MIKEIVQFTKSLDERFKNLGIKPKEGLHIILKIVEEDNVFRLDIENLEYERFTNKLQESEFIEKCKFLSTNAWYVSSNKSFDKGIHTASPFCVAFKGEFLKGGGKNVGNKEQNKKEIPKRFKDKYFANVFEFLSANEREKYKVFEDFFAKRDFEDLLKVIMTEFSVQTQIIDNQIDLTKKHQNNSNNKEEKEDFKKDVTKFELEKEKYKPLDDTDYFIFYLDESLEKYKEIHQKYLADKLFNVDDYKTPQNDKAEIFGISGFLNSMNSGGNKVFWVHHTATFNISQRISSVDAKYLYDFEKVLKQSILPNPLPVFIFKDELQKDIISFFKESAFNASYKEIIEGLWEKYQEDFGSYYLLFYANTQDGLVFKDFDFVTKFQYELRDIHGRSWEVEDFFGINHSFQINNVFSLQQQILQVIFNNSLIVKTKKGDWIYKYFDDIDQAYCKSSKNYLLIMQYRKACYDYIYKTKKQAISNEMYHHILRTSILEDIRLDEVKNNNHSEYFNIRKKLNIWFSLYEKFNHNFNPNDKTMASKLKEYRQFMDALADDKADLTQTSLEEFAFATGQIIYYILQKSKSANTSYQRLEPYLQQSTCEGLKKAIANTFTHYKHESYSARFERASAFVLTYQTEVNMKKVLPEILAGIFSNNQLFPKKDNTVIQ